MSVTQLVYYSRNTTAGADRVLLQQLRDVLKASQRNNERDGVTGYLIFDRTWFVQILEGDRRTVMATYGRLQPDPRHGRVTVIDTRDVAARSFAQWSMGGTMRNLDQQEIFLRHGIGGEMDPTRMTASAIVALARDLQDHELSRREALRKAS